MRITEQFLEMIMHDFTLNQTQFTVLGQSYPAVKGWESLVLETNISREDANLLVLLKGKLALRGQETIVKNYQLMLEFNQKSIEVKKVEPVEIEQVTNTLKIYCDGACSGNPGNAGSGLALYEGNKKPILLHGQYAELGTNNTAELNALYKALEIASSNKSTHLIEICSDSKYSIDCITKWAYSWKAKGWTKKGGEIKNLDLIKKAHALFEEIKDKIVIKHVKGHAGIEGNELADRMAVMAIIAKNVEYQNYSYENVSEVLDLKRG